MMACMNGGYEGTDNPDSIRIDNEPYINFNVGIGGMDYITTFSQLKKEYKIMVFRNKHGRNISRGYLIEKPTTVLQFKYHFGNIDDPDEVFESELTYYDVWNYDAIVSYGETEENENKAREWFKKKQEEERSMTRHD